MVFLLLLFTDFAFSNRKLLFTDDDEYESHQHHLFGEFNCATVPTSFWCASDKVQHECEAHKLQFHNVQIDNNNKHR
jgi:hypothetical protein